MVFRETAFETFLIWSGSNPSAVQRMWVSLLRDALVNGLLVRILHGEASGAITGVTLSTSLVE